ncbi:PD-(D/E)XK motif protein [Pseudomonas sp. PvP046]|uniref:PD-(D/E)XK motif protein n=2 Tax=unclassified Pseudomonas TaxID=196821 RepID=UPI003396BE3E
MRMRMTKTMNNSVFLWSSTSSGSSEKSGAGFSRVDASHSLDFYLGFDKDGRHTLLLICNSRPDFQSDLKLVRVKCVARDDGRWSLFLMLEDIALLEIFSLLCSDLIESSRDIPNVEEALGFVLQRLASWRLLFERGDLGLLSESEIRGLCGELLYLHDLTEIYGCSLSVASWVGPYLADQDFQMDTIAWEVKTLRPGISDIFISSERQLDSSVREIVLVVYEVANCSTMSVGAFTLNSLVKKLRASIKASYDSRVMFDKALFRAGYIERSEYDEINLVVREVSSYSVGLGFPCITKAMLPNGISETRYKLDISLCETFKVSVA